MAIRIGIAIFSGLAASSLFFPIRKYLLEWSYPWDLVSTAAVFVVAMGLAAFFANRDSAVAKTVRSLMSGNTVKGTMTGKIDGLETKESPAEVLSGNDIKGDANFQIKNTKL
jgi:hypothetical protein